MSSSHTEISERCSSSSMSKFTNLPQIPGTDFDRCVLDVFRTAATAHLSKHLEIPLETAFTGVDLGNLKAKSDFTVAVPRFRLKAKPADLVAKVVNGVCVTCMTTTPDPHAF